MENVLKTKLIALIVALYGSADAELHDPIESSTEALLQFSYLTVGLGYFPVPEGMGYYSSYPMPAVGAGYWFQRGHHGFDISLNGATAIGATALKGTVLYHYYFKPNLCSQYYIGVGPSFVGKMTSEWNVHYNFDVAPEFVFGKQYKNKNSSTRFFEVDIDYPLLFNDDHFRQQLPRAMIRYGIGF